jgi:hypothetical protein
VDYRKRTTSTIYNSVGAVTLVLIMSVFLLVLSMTTWTSQNKSTLGLRCSHHGCRLASAKMIGINKVISVESGNGGVYGEKVARGRHVSTYRMFQYIADVLRSTNQHSHHTWCSKSIQAK